MNVTESANRVSTMIAHLIKLSEEYAATHQETVKNMVHENVNRIHQNLTQELSPVYQELQRLQKELAETRTRLHEKQKDSAQEAPATAPEA